MLNKILPRSFLFLVLAIIAVAYLIWAQPIQFEVVLYKLCMIFVGAFIGYRLDRSLFPYARPDGYLKNVWQHGTAEPIGAADYEIVAGYEWVFALAMLRRTVIVLAVILGMTLGL